VLEADRKREGLMDLRKEATEAAKADRFDFRFEIVAPGRSAHVGG
jgi:hypothetical protein